MKIYYEWDIEVVEGEPADACDDSEILEHIWSESARRCLRMMKVFPSDDGTHYRPALIREVWTGQSLVSKSWAYLLVGDDGLWRLPDAFLDAGGVVIQQVPHSLRVEMHDAQTKNLSN